jgi:hypothetical protein
VGDLLRSRVRVRVRGLLLLARSLVREVRNAYRLRHKVKHVRYSAEREPTFPQIRWDHRTSIKVSRDPERWRHYYLGEWVSEDDRPAGGEH